MNELDKKKYLNTVLHLKDLFFNIKYALKFFTDFMPVGVMFLRLQKINSLSLYLRVSLSPHINKHLISQFYIVCIIKKHVFT